MNTGTQIAYVPMHAGGDLNHPDVEFGFVTREATGHHWCRYWRRGQPGQLRTVANSELTSDDCLVVHASVLQTVVDGCLSMLGYAAPGAPEPNN